MDTRVSLANVLPPGFDQTCLSYGVAGNQNRQTAQAIPGGVVLPEGSYFCPLCGVAYNINRNQTCFCLPMRGLS